MYIDVLFVEKEDNMDIEVKGIEKPVRVRKKRIPLKDRILPTYTVAEEIFNMVSHIVGAVFGIAALVLCVIMSASHHDAWGIVGSSIYGASMIVLYTMSAVYHGLGKKTEKLIMAKKVMQVVDHCTIYFLIAGTYTPILFTSIRKESPVWCWIIFGLVWGFAVIGGIFTGIDLKKYSIFSMCCYIGMGWCIVLAAKTAIAAIPLMGLLWLLIGGIAYTIGAVLYGLGKRKKWMHGIFHVFCLIGSIAQFICILFYVL